MSNRIPAAMAVALLVPCLAGTSSQAVITAKLACTREGVTASAAAVMAANQRTHAVSSDYSWSRSSVHDVVLKTSLTITEAGTYRVHGRLKNGRIVINSSGNGVVRLILAGVKISNATTAAINVIAAAKAVVVLEPGTTNSLTDGVSRAAMDDSPAALYSRAALTITGGGTLLVHGRYRDGIASSDGLVIAGGIITVTAKDDGVRGKDYVHMSRGRLGVTSGGDGIRSAGSRASTVGYVYIGGGKVTVNAASDAIRGISDVVIAGGTLRLKAAMDGIKSSCISYVTKATVTISAGGDAVHSDGETVVRGGSIEITKAYEGLQGASLEISGGTLRMTTSNDGLHVAADSASMTPPTPQPSPTSTKVPVFSNSVVGRLAMSGGTVVISTLGDGIDVNGPATISGGRLIISGPVATKDAALDVIGEFRVIGGMIIGVGPSTAAMGPSLTSPQASVLANLAAVLDAGSIVHLTDGSGRLLANFKSVRPFQSLVFTAPSIVRGQAYTVYVGGSVSGASLGGYYAKGARGGATAAGTFTAGDYSNPSTPPAQ